MSISNKFFSEVIRNDDYNYIDIEESIASGMRILVALVRKAVYKFIFIRIMGWQPSADQE